MSDDHGTVENPHRFTGGLLARCAACARPVVTCRGCDESACLCGIRELLRRGQAVRLTGGKIATSVDELEASL